MADFGRKLPLVSDQAEGPVRVQFGRVEHFSRASGVGGSAVIERRVPKAAGQSLNVDYICNMTWFGEAVREKREHLRKEDKRYSLRQVAQRIGVEPAQST